MKVLGLRSTLTLMKSSCRTLVSVLKQDAGVISAALIVGNK